MIKLRIIIPGQEDRIITVEGDEAVIGRGANCDVVIPEGYVSGRHAKVLSGLIVVDLGSTNGTFVNGIRVREATLIQSGTFKLGAEQGDARIEIVGNEPVDHVNASMTMVRPDSGSGEPQPKAPGMQLERRIQELEEERARMRLEVLRLQKELEAHDRPATDLLSELRDEVRRLKGEQAQSDSQPSTTTDI